MDLVIVFLSTLLASAMSSMSGGGSSAVTIPVFLAMGMSFPLASAVQKTSTALWVVTAAFNYLKGKKIDWLFLISVSVVGLIGAYVGVRIILSVPQEIIERVVGICILGIVAYVALKKELGMIVREVRAPVRRFLMYPCALVMGVYESVFGAGNGILFALSSWFTRGYDFMTALGYYFAVSSLWLAFAAAMLITKGYYDIPVMITAVTGSVLGAYGGSKYARMKGNQFVKIMYVVIGGLLGLKLVLEI